ncbi:MAG: VWA domain-containing protein [Acidobacteria bacterium]|nr:VWA domain-containing protein [Acidobacteriota bacterium]
MPVIFLCLWLGFGSASVWAQQTPSSQGPVEREEGTPPIRVLVEEATVPFIVSDSKNRFITDLGKEDFQVFEEKQPQTIRSFSKETDVPLRMGLLIDTSNSIRDRFVFEQEAAADFLRALLRPGKDKAFLASFDTMAELVQDFTDDLGKLVEAIQILRTGGGTALYDAIYYGARDRLLEEAPPTSEFRRALVVLSDGEDNQSRFSRLQALEMAQRAEITIYSISTNIRGLRMPGDKVLQEFAEETGGRYFQPFRWEDLNTAFQEIDAELRSQYSLSYRPTTPRDGHYHAIEIVPRKKGLRVRARRGYYATQPPGMVPSNSAVQGSTPTTP